jgi:hypothetical protein
MDEETTDKPIKSILKPDTIMELRAWPVIKPIAPTLIASLLLMAGVLEGMKDKLGYKSLVKLRMNEIGYNVSHESV